MRALRSCDFCGDQAVGTFEVVPEELDPTEADRRRVVLCEPCKDRLQTLIEPLVEHARKGTDGDTTGSDTGEAGESADGGTDDELIGADSDGRLLGESDPAESTTEESEPAASDQTTDETAPDDGDANEDTGGSDPPDRGREQSNSPPDNYGKVLRLLRNREFPMTREEVVTIATSAYQLDTRNVQAIIDESLERGEFAEVDGQLEQR